MNLLPSYMIDHLYPEGSELVRSLKLLLLWEEYFLKLLSTLPADFQGHKVVNFGSKVTSIAGYKVNLSLD